MTLQLEQTPQHNHERRLGRRDHYFICTFSEMTDPALAQEAWRVHGEGYVGEGFVTAEALTPEGYLPDSIDKARGASVEYSLASERDVDSRNTLSPKRATMRKISIPEGSGVDFLPAYQLCANHLEPQYKEYLESIENPSEHVKEIAALARTTDASPMAVFELLRDAVQGAQGKDEVWFFSIVSTTYDSLVDNFGPNAIKQVGTPVSFDDDRIGEGVELVPALVRTDLFLDEIRRSIETSNDNHQKNQLTRSFMFFTEGLRPDELSKESAEFRDYMTEIITRNNRGGVA